MNRISVLFAALAFAGLAVAADTPVAPLAAATAPAAAATPSLSATPQSWAGKMLDPSQNAAAFKDPAVLAQLSNAMMNPALATALMQQGIDPNSAIRMLSGMANPAAMQNFGQFVDPAIAMKWMAAGLDPRLINTLLSQGINPSAYLNTMMAPMNPQMLNLGGQMMNPGMYGNWMGAPMNPAAMNAMMPPMNPNLYGNWMGAGMDPRAYGAWGQVMPMPNGQFGGMPIDPAVLMKMLQSMPAQPAK